MRTMGVQRDSGGHASSPDFPGIVAVSRHMHDTLALVARVAPHDTAVLLSGETGTGKELLARAIHARSPRAHRPLVSINCAAIPDTLLESELFGYRKGAFTSAHADKPGLVAAAAGGTLFLDELAELPLPLQAKLLRVLQEGTYFPLGAVRSEHTSVRVIAATNAPLRERVADGRFRRDLYHRLSAFPIEVPSLRERPADIGVLAQHFLRELNRRAGAQPRELAPDAIRSLTARTWPGNARELRNAVERAMIISTGSVLRSEDFSFLEDATGPHDGTGSWVLPVDGIDLRALNRGLVQAALRRERGNVTRAARLLGLSRPALRYRLKKYGLGSS
jgi:transcriptional regulator with GAF, ATPase, and Fis domain